jgi:ABC-type uncharacterized transport system substrate-binding protein
MKRFVVCVALTLILCVSTTGVNAWARDAKPFGIDPVTNNGEKWRIGYYEGGGYIDYQQILTATIKGLMTLGWIETAEIPPQDGEQTESLWRWLSSTARSPYLSFPADAHYTANWNDDLRPKAAAAVVERLNTKKDIDMMLAFGTWAGKDLATDAHDTPTVVISASDPLAAGIIKSVEDSGYDHVHATVDPYFYERQIRIFHDIIGFDKLGIAYEDTVDGRSYAAIDKVERIAGERGFEIVRCHTQSDVEDAAVAEKSVKDCFHQLGKTADALYVTVQGGINARSLPELVKIVNSCDIPTFSQSGSQEVKAGFLMSIAQAGFRYIGRFHAETIAKILNGAQPRRLDQVFEEPPKIAINLRTAEIIGYDPPVDVLGAADEIYQEIAAPQPE